MVAFNDPWYAEKIAQCGPDKDDENAPVAYAILVGFAMLSQAVDSLTDAVKKVADNIPGNVE